MTESRSQLQITNLVNRLEDLLFAWQDSGFQPLIVRHGNLFLSHASDWRVQLVEDSRFQQSLGVPRSSRNGNLQPREIRVERFGGVGMRCSQLVGRTIRTPKDNGDVELPAGHRQHVWCVVDYLIKRHK